MSWTLVLSASLQTEATRQVLAVTLACMAILTLKVWLMLQTELEEKERKHLLKQGGKEFEGVLDRSQLLEQDCESWGSATQV